MRRGAVLAVSLVVLGACDRRSEGDRQAGLSRTLPECAVVDGRPAGCEARLEELLADGVAPVRRRAIERTVLARALAERYANEARSGGAPSKEEIERAADFVWPRFNDGPFVSVVHALFPRGADSAERIDAFLASLRDVTSPEAFEAAAHKAGSDVVVERIEQLGNRRRTWAGSELEASFANAAIVLTPSSPRSGPVHTSYGTHVLLLTDRIDAPVVDANKRSDALAEEAIGQRVRDRVEGLVVRAPARIELDARSVLKSLGDSGAPSKTTSR